MVLVLHSTHLILPCGPNTNVPNWARNSRLKSTPGPNPIQPDYPVLIVCRREDSCDAWVPEGAQGSSEFYRRESSGRVVRPRAYSLLQQLIRGTHQCRQILLMDLLDLRRPSPIYPIIVIHEIQQRSVTSSRIHI